MIQLSGNGYEVGLDPENGAQITHATFAGREILRTRRGDTSPNPLGSASFPLVPYSNRILKGRFTFQGEAFEIGRNWTGDANAIHGEGWRNDWRVVRNTGTRCELATVIEEGWPWRCRAAHMIEVTPNGILLRLSVENIDMDPFPVGLGLHPYFAKEENTVLRFEANKKRPPLGEGVPPFAPVQGPVVVDVNHDRLDDCFGGWNGLAEIVHPNSGRMIRIETLEPVSWCVVFVPKGERYFCFEPVSHATGAFNSEHPETEGVTLLKPGQSKTISVRISEQLS